MPEDGLIPQSPSVDPEDRPTTSSRRSRAGAGKRRPLLVRLLPVMIVVVALGSFAGIVGYYYFAASGSNGVVPLIKADVQPFKIKPDNPGGMDVPDQDKEIYDRVGRADRGSVPPASAERLLPPPETPLPRPAPVNPNLGGSVLGAPPPARPATLSAAPPPLPGAPPASAPAAPPPPAEPVPAPVAVAKTQAPPAAAPAPARVAAPAAAPAPAATKTAAVTPAPSTGRGDMRAAIASLRSEADAHREWDRQRRLNPEGLAGVTPEYGSIDLGDRGVYWRIYVGPRESNAEAQARCAVLKQKRVDCFVARP
jgi:SPOR domain